jgi:hypothetical protein
MRDICADLNLPVSAKIIAPRLEHPDYLPETAGELDIIIHAVLSELEERLFLCAPSRGKIL